MSIPAYACALCTQCNNLAPHSVVWPLECVPCFIEETHHVNPCPPPLGGNRPHKRGEIARGGEGNESIATPSPSVTFNEHLPITIPQKTPVYTFSALFFKKWIPIVSKGKTLSLEALKCLEVQTARTHCISQ